MRPMLHLMTVSVLCSAAVAATEEPGSDPRLLEAQAAFEGAAKLKDVGKYAESLAAAERALTLRTAVLGEKHLLVAECMNLAGNAARLAGDYPRSEALFLRALAIREALLGKSHPDVATSLNDLGALYYVQGIYDRAEPLQLRSLAIRETALGKNHLDVAASLANLANLYADQGLYSRAESLYERALDIRKSALGENHRLVAALVNNLAILYVEQGLYDRAEQFHRRGLAIREATLGKDHPEVATSLHNLATLYAQQGMYDRAEPLYERALSILEASLGKNHPDVAMSLGNLASVYAGQGKYDRAEPLHLRALAIRESVFGRDNAEVATSLLKLAGLYSEQGWYRRAEPLLARALTIRERALGANHPLVAQVLNDLAVVRLARHRLPEALPLFTRAFIISERRLRQEALGFSEARLESLLDLLRGDEERLYSLLRAHPENAGVRRLAFSAALLIKGRSAAETADISRAIYRSLSNDDRASFERLRDLRVQFARLTFSGPGKLAPSDHEQRLKDLADQGDALEAELGKRSAGLRALTTLPSSADIVERVAGSLPQDGALVELMAYVDRPLVPRPGTPRLKVPSELRYLALVLLPGGSTGAVDLGPAAPIDAAAVRLRDALAGQEAAFMDAAQKLHQLVVKPLLPVLGKARKLFLSPDGQLELVPFAALHDGRRFFGDAFDLTYLTGGKELLPRPGEIPGSSSVAVFADPDYGSGPLTEDAGVAPLRAEGSDPIERFFGEHRASLGEQRWAPLPGTRREAEAIQSLLPGAQLFLGADASKERLLRLPTPGILHIATHGFFLEDAGGAPGGRGLTMVGSTPRPVDPLLRSGLVLGGVHSDISNSLMTALELAGLDLWGTELVVLSACDTGRGDVKRGQGLYGLRRALVIAGAETVVVSLWRVDDETTRAMMESYYHNLLAGRGRAEALKGAMLSLRAQYPHPHYWAPFIAIGRDTPLRAFVAPAQQP